MLESPFSLMLAFSEARSKPTSSGVSENMCSREIRMLRIPTLIFSIACGVGVAEFIYS